MRIRRLAPAIAAFATAGWVATAGPAAAAGGTDYFGADNSGNLVRVTITGNEAGSPTVVRRGNPETKQTSAAGSDGGVVVGTVADIDAGTATMFTYDTATRQFHDLSSLGKHIGAAAIYDNGARIAYSRRVKHFSVIRSAPAAGGPTTTLYRSKVWSPWDIAVSENGQALFFSASERVSVAGEPNSTTHRSNVFRLTANGKQKLESDVADPLRYTQIQLSPGGGRLAVVRQKLSGSPRARFTVVRLSTGHVRTVLKSYANSIAGVAWAADGSSLVFRDETGWARVDLHGRIDAIAKTGKLTAPVLAS